MTKLSSHRGFTIIEVTLVLAISSLIIVGVMMGTSGSIARQRYNDSVNDIVDYLRSTYSEVINVQNYRPTTTADNVFCSTASSLFPHGGSPYKGLLMYYDNLGNSITEDKLGDISLQTGRGRTNCAIYGKLITFGEKENNQITDTIHSYDIVGRVYNPDLDKDLDQGQAKTGYDADYDKTILGRIGADVLSIDIDTTSNSCKVIPAGNTSARTIQWDAHIQTEAPAANGEYTPLRGALAIIRSPVSGTIHSYYADIPGNDPSLDINNNISSAYSGSFSEENNTCTFSDVQVSQLKHFFNIFLKDDDHGLSSGRDVTLCVGSDDISVDTSRRRAIRIKGNGHNSTAVELLNLDVIDDGEYPCQ